MPCPQGGCAAGRKPRPRKSPLPTGRGDGATTSAANRYCERLGLPQVPRVEDAVSQEGATLFDLLVIALLERGEPMQPEDVARRLQAAGVQPPSGDLRGAVRASWHGRQPVYREPDGRFGLNVSSGQLEWLIDHFDLRGVTAALPPPPADGSLLVQPGPDTPLSMEELDAAYRNGSLLAVSPYRQAAAVLDAQGRPMAATEIAALLAAMNTRYGAAVTEESVRRGRGGMVEVGTDGLLRLNPSAADIGAMRSRVRETARPVLVQRAHSRDTARWREAHDALQAARRRDLARASEKLRRAVLRVVPGGGAAPQGAALLDVAERTLRTFPPGAIADLAGALDAFDVVAALDVRATLAGLGLDPERWRLADLSPPRKTWKLNRAGRQLDVTAELLIRGTTGVSHALGDPAKVAEYLGGGDTAKLRRRLESDAKALYGFYRYGILHRAVRLRWGYVDELLGVDWALPGEPHLQDILREAQAVGRPVDLVGGAAPGWADPWARALRAYVVGVEAWSVLLRFPHGFERVDVREIQAVRLAEGDAPVPQDGSAG